MPLPSPEPTVGSRDRSGLAPDAGPSADDAPRAVLRMLRSVVEIQARLIQGEAPRGALRQLLAQALEVTGSTSGCLLEAPLDAGVSRHEVHLPGEAPGSEAHALRARVEALGSPADAPREELPGPRSAPLLLPLEVEGVRVGAMGLGGRPGGYEAGTGELLQPVLLACGSILLGEQRERRRCEAEQVLRQQQQASAERLHLVMDNMQDGVWLLDTENQQLFTNDRWLGMLGYAPGELEISLETWLRLCHPEDAAESRRLLESQRPEASTELEQRVRHRDGHWVWVLVRYVVVARDANGRMARVLGTNADITARKRDEQRLRVLVDVLPDLVFRIGADGIFRDHYIGSRTEHELAVSVDRVIGYNVRDLPMAPVYIDRFMYHLGRAVREGTLEVVEYPLDQPEGRRYYESRLLRSAPDEVVAIVRNITERKQIEERLRQHEEQLRLHRDSLEEQVRNRSEKLLRATLELEKQQAQLIQSEKMASLGQMAAGVAHEINNPMSYVMSNLGTLDQYVSSLTPLLAAQHALLANMDVPPDPELLRHLRELWEEGDLDYMREDMPQLIEESLAGTRRIKEIVQSLRSFAREDTGEPQLVDVNVELASTLKIVWNELKYKCEVKRDFGPLPTVSCHPTQISQVFTNLLVNAAQAIETRGEIRIRTRQEGPDVLVEIADTGKGMSQETISKLFTPFFTTKPRGQGTGLGLSVSYGIITRHQGRIDVQSEPGRGSTFTIRLPATRA